jgi:mono/diheme cytochrome c family protein
MGLRLYSAALAVLFLGGCNWYYDTLPSPDDLMKLVPWFDHMIDSRAVHPYESGTFPRYAVPGTVPVTGAEGDWRAEFGAGNSATADRLVNPTDAAATLAVGDSLYQTFCSVCHGPTGAATDATVGPRLAAPSLLTDRARAYSDGYLYSMVRYGRGVMFPYGDKVYRPEHRWAIVNYLRKLQADTAPAAVIPATPVGGQ